MWHRYILCTIVMIALGSQSATPAAKPGSSRREARAFNEPGEVMPGVVMVKFTPSVVVANRSTTTSSTEVNATLSEVGATSLVQTFPGVRVLTATDLAAGMVDVSRIYYAFIEASVDPRYVAGRLSTVEGIEYAEPKFMHYLNDIPNDPLVPTQTNAFTRMNAFNGWTIAKGDSNVAIATVDGGTYWQHEDLNTNLWVNTAEDINANGRFDPGPPPAGDEDGIDQDANGFVDDVIGWNFANNTNNPRGLPATPNSAHHGTYTASNFGARTNNSIGMAGSSWNCRLMSVNSASPIQDNGIAYGFEGIAYAYLKGAKVINCSWGRVGGFSLFEQDLVNAATQAGALVVASSGNGGPDQIGDNNDLLPHYPSSYKNVLGVGATNSTSDAKAGFSNYGVTVPVYAPGVSILSANNSGGYSSSGISGTSFSSPLVAGLAGIVKSFRPTWTPRQIATQIRVTADSIDAANPSFSGRMGRGRVNFARALSESHAGIEIVSATIQTTTGSSLFLPGDTIVATVTVKNIMFVAANNLNFTATTSDASLSVLQGTANAGTLAPDQQITLPQFRFRVGALTVAKDIAIKLDWVSNINERDAWAFKVTVFPAVPQWEKQVSPTQTALYSVRAVSPSIVWASGGSGTGAAPVVIKTTDGGANWSLATGNLTGVDLYCVFALDADRAWVGTGNGRIYGTTDGGATWTQRTYPGTQSPFINGVWMFNDGVGYAQGDPASGGRFVVLKTTDYGQSWVHANEPTGTASEAGWNNSFWWTSQTHGWFGTNQNKVWRTTDGGATWASATSGATNSYGVAFKDNNNGIVIHSTGAIRVSVNGGATWTSTSSPTTSPLIGVSYLSATNSAWVANGTTPYRSTNNGTNWTAQTLYPYSGSLYHISFHDTSNGWAVTSNGEVLKYRLPGTTSVDPEPTTIPREYSLEQNYPNPFNPTTVITFRLPVASRVSLKVFDLLGRELTTLVNGERRGGVHTIEFNASSLPTGIYYYQLKAGSFSETKRMILIK